MTLQKMILVILCAYLLGSFPTALLYSRLAHGKDIRDLGDGNMGARNSKRNFGWVGGVLVALADIIKGALAVLMARWFGLAIEGQMACGAAAIIGHDFPVFARFKGGQGFAATTGVFLGLFPLITLVGAMVYFLLFFMTRNSDLAAGVGMGLIAADQLFTGAGILVVGFIVLTLLFIPFKKWLDRSRVARQSDNPNHGAAA
jgi:acyl phosphate:glycerol-3-phosphate acyltransferase